MCQRGCCWLDTLQHFRFLFVVQTERQAAVQAGSQQNLLPVYMAMPGLFGDNRLFPICGRELSDLQTSGYSPRSPPSVLFSDQNEGSAVLPVCHHKNDTTHRPAGPRLSMAYPGKTAL